MMYIMEQEHFYPNLYGFEEMKMYIHLAAFLDID